MLRYARTVGGPPLRRMTFPERGRMLKALALYLMERKEGYYQLSYRTGATKAVAHNITRPRVLRSLLFNHPKGILVVLAHQTAIAPARSS